MISTDIAIIGGGLSGLYLAYCLEQEGFDYVLVEAKEQLGGRIFSPISPLGESQGIDLGPTWFWPHQKNILNLIETLDLSIFEQHTQGDVLYQQHPDKPPQRHHGTGSPLSYRLIGGIQNLINRLEMQVKASRIYCSYPVSHIEKDNSFWCLSSATASNTSASNPSTPDIRAKQLVLAAPPRVLMQYLSLSTFLPEGLLMQLSATPTWMAAQAKFIASYDSPFWRQQGLSGDIFSRVGPMTEVHDASTHHSSTQEDANYALFGFIGIPAHQRANLEDKELNALCLQQLVNALGKSALNPRSTYLKDWAKDSWVATSLDINEAPNHPSINLAAYSKSLKTQALHFVGAEYAQTESGYLEGALLSTQTVLNDLLKKPTKTD